MLFHAFFIHLMFASFFRLNIQYNVVTALCLRSMFRHKKHLVRKRSSLHTWCCCHKQVVWKYSVLWRLQMLKHRPFPLPPCVTGRSQSCNLNVIHFKLSYLCFYMLNHSQRIWFDISFCRRSRNKHLQLQFLNERYNLRVLSVLSSFSWKESKLNIFPCRQNHVAWVQTSESISDIRQEIRADAETR